MKSYKKVMGWVVVVIGLATLWSCGHCEVPCGIYDDAARIEMMKEDLNTIEKAMLQINTLTGSDAKSFQQRVRWVNTKEEHADKVQAVVTQYFMTQRIKVGSDVAEDQLVALHKILVGAMKCKQSSSVENVATTRAAVMAFDELYNKK